MIVKSYSEYMQVIAFMSPPVQSLLRRENLPKAYRESHIPTDIVSDMVHLCLTDMSFPSFVEDVDKEIKRLADSNA